MVAAEEIVIDNFAGGGGASLGIEEALDRPVDVAVNHDPEAIAMHRANHPHTQHLCEDVWAVDPAAVAGVRTIGVAWFSPDCTHFSRAKGAKPVERGRRCLADVVLRWTRLPDWQKPRRVFLENVAEFKDWGPLDEFGRPKPEGRGLEFKRWLAELQGCGYRVELRELVAADYGAPTSRRRLFVIARCDGEPIVWPTPTHGLGRMYAWRTAAECIEWALPTPSIFDRPRPLAEPTLRRIARGIKKYVLECSNPFVVNDVFGPFIAGVGGRQWQSPERSVDRPYQTITTKADSVLVAPTLIQTGYGARALDICQPLGTVVAGGVKHALCAAFLAKHYGGHETPGTPLSLPISTVTTQDHHHLVRLPLGAARPEVRAFLIKYYGCERQDPQLRLPLHTVTTVDRFGVVTVAGAQYEIADIGMRMLQPRELFRAQGFPDTYQIDVDIAGKPLSKASQVRMCGNSVCPPLAAALVRANVYTNVEAVA